jgi:hypothetical protein
MHVVTYRASWSCSDVRPGCLLVTHTLTLQKKKKKKKKKKKNFAPVTRMVVVTRRFVTYGIRAGSTRDLGFTTGSVDMTY